MIEQEVAIVTGGSRGIGRAIAIELAREGIKVCITYLKEKEKALKCTSSANVAILSTRGS